MVPSPSWAVVCAAAEEALTETFDKEMTLGQFMGKLAESLSVNYQDVKMHKASLKELIAQKTTQESSSSDDENQDPDEEDQDGHSPDNKSKDDEDNDSKGMIALRAMAKAMNLHRYDTDTIHR